MHNLSFLPGKKASNEAMFNPAMLQNPQRQADISLKTDNTQSFSQLFEQRLQQNNQPISPEASQSQFKQADATTQKQAESYAENTRDKNDQKPVVISARPEKQTDKPEVVSNRETQSENKQIKTAKKTQPSEEETSTQLAHLLEQIKILLNPESQAKNNTENSAGLSRSAEHHQKPATRSIREIRELIAGNKNAAVESDPKMKDLLNRIEKFLDHKTSQADRHQSRLTAQQKFTPELKARLHGPVEKTENLLHALSQDVERAVKMKQHAAIRQTPQNQQEGEIKVNATLTRSTETADPAKAIKELNSSSENAMFSGKESSVSNTLSRQSTLAGDTLKQTPVFKDAQFQELLNRAKVTVTDNKNSSLTMRMNPESLGRININLGLENGVLHAKFVVESEEAKTALQNNMSQLRERLLAEGIEVGSFDVNVEDRQQGFGNRFAENHENLTILNALHAQSGSRNRDGAGAESPFVSQSSTHEQYRKGSVDVVI